MFLANSVKVYGIKRQNVWQTSMAGKYSKQALQTSTEKSTEKR
jgi:hypothetical protein